MVNVVQDLRVLPKPENDEKAKTPSPMTSRADTSPAPSSQLPPSLVSGVTDGTQQLVGGRNPFAAEDDRAVLANDEYRPVDLFSIDPGLPRYRFERAIITRNRQPRIDQQFKRQLQMRLESLVTIEIVIIDAEWNGIETSIRVECPANRGQLVRSPRGKILWIENQ